MRAKGRLDGGRMFIDKIVVLLAILTLILLILLMAQKVIKDIYELKELKEKWKEKNRFEKIVKRLEKTKEEKEFLEDKCMVRCDWTRKNEINHEIMALNDVIKIVKKEGGIE